MVKERGVKINLSFQDSCIDTYCVEDEAGRAQRASMKELYLRSLILNKENKENTDNTVDFVRTPPTRTTTTGTKRKLDVKDSDEEEEEGGGDQKEGKKKARNTNYVYGSGKGSSKQRRCGECEGCTRDDCGGCQACADKPKFGGKGTKKRACVMRVCRMKAMKRSLLETAAEAGDEADNEDE